MSFFFAWQLLTVLPSGQCEPVIQRPGRSMAWFPLVGLIIGAMLALFDFLLTRLLPSLPATALLLAAWVAVTGGLHLDGFIDCCDGLLVAKTAEQRLEIMKDSRVGAFGVIGAICLLLVKFSALAALAPGDRVNWLLVIPVLSRWTMVWAAWRYPLARSDGFAAWFREGLAWPHTLIAGSTALLVALLLGGLGGLASFAAIWLFALAFAILVQGRIPGLTGDVYGALNELAEVVGLLLAIMLGGPVL
ncbi:MAG: adenosylcobinamide-GDP ribazoletransferase [Anaerolineae bacterium]|jgi:adenosylcobinamide-GDP ribazoletransferase